jgi:hypothetical protein
VSDIFDGYEVASQVRYAIVKEFAAKKIEMPTFVEVAKVK